MAREETTLRRLWPLSPRAKLWAAAGAVLVGLGVVAWLSSDKSPLVNLRVPKGHPFCPPTPAPTAGLSAGDYVILTLENRAATFKELVWGQVLSRSPDGSEFLVRLLGTTGETGAVELAKDKHGFRIGEQVKVDADCVWDTMAQPDTGGKGQLFCGFLGENLVGSAPMLVKDIQPRDEVKVVVSTLIGTDAHAEQLWTRVDGVSRTGNVVYGTIVSPIQFPIHGFRQWQKIQFSRDCIFDWRRP